MKVILESLDGKEITPRTGKSKVVAETSGLPEEGGYQKFLYIDQDCESPGVYIATDGVERLKNEIKFYDINKRQFKMTILDN